MRSLVMIRVTELDLYLAATMRPSGNLADRLARSGVTPQMLKRARASATKAGFGDPRQVTRELLDRHFGAPERVEPHRVRYPLSLWPDHEYEWEVEDWGGASHGGFRRVNEFDMPSWSPSEAHTATMFAPWLHTAHDVRQALGDPDLDQSWGATWG